jgi:adenosylhomocysteine nucleosidase
LKGQDTPVFVVATFALNGEFAAWRRLRLFRRCTAGPVPAYETRIGGNRLRVVLTGIGPRAASAAAATVFQNGPDLCIASGLAAGLSQALCVADVIAPESVQGPDGCTIDADPSLLALAVSCGARRVSTLYSAPSIVVTSEQKRQLSVVGDAVDMESTTILCEGHDRGVPGIAIRAISDPAAIDLPLDLNRVLTARGGVSLFRAIGGVARRPQAVPGLVRLGVDGRRAAVALSAFLDAYVEHAACGQHRS